MRLVPVFGARLPVAAVANNTLHDVSLDSSVVVIDIAVVAVPTIFALKYEVPLVTFIPPEVTLKPCPAVTIPTESTFVTSSYVKTPVTSKLPVTLAPAFVVSTLFVSLKYNSTESPTFALIIS